jgi:hypothetical protein
MKAFIIDIGICNGYNCLPDSLQRRACANACETNLRSGITIGGMSTFVNE